jgi:predicted transcriptional regulator
MPVTKPELVAFKVSPTLEAKLQDLCRQTHRTRSEVMRALLSTATLEDLPSHWRGPDAHMLAEIES